MIITWLRNREVAGYLAPGVVTWPTLAPVPVVALAASHYIDLRGVANNRIDLRGVPNNRIDLRGKT